MGINLNSGKMRILLSPLDWGLGHTTRCIPIINELLKKNVEVVLAGNETQKKVLLSEFPQCEFHYLEGYNIRYSNRKIFLPLRILMQVPQILSSIKNENVWLKEIIYKLNIKGVISDNRYGLYHHSVPSYFITHQLQVKSNMGGFADNVVRKLNHRRIEKFTHCWIPDFEGEDNLAGDLSHPVHLPSVPITYLGSISRMGTVSKDIRKEEHLLVIISGPEPQRSIFEKIVFNQLKIFKGLASVVRGLPYGANIPELGDNIRVYNHLSVLDLKEAFAKASIVICRSGYSSVMDINSIQAKSILVPTPGQSEQEYLGKYLMEKGFAIVENQSNFDLQNLMFRKEQFPYNGFVKNNSEVLSKAIDGFLQDCDNRCIATL